MKIRVYKDEEYGEVYGIDAWDENLIESSFARYISENSTYISSSSAGELYNNCGLYFLIEDN